MSFLQRKLSLSVTTWMCVPEFEMKNFEVLCRGSAFLTPVRSWSGDKRPKKPSYHVLTCSHVVAPWRWPKLYPDEYLRHVSEKHTHYTIEMRHEHGEFAHQADLITKVYHHPTRDLAVMHIELEDDTTELYMKSDIETELEVVKERSRYYPLKVGQDVAFIGHDAISPAGPEAASLAEATGSRDFDDESKYDRWMLPTIIDGKIQGRTEKQIFAVTRERLLPVGMCGGPVVVNRQWDQMDFKPAVQGMNARTLHAPWEVPNLSSHSQSSTGTTSTSAGTSSSTVINPRPTAARGKRSPVSLDLARTENMRVHALRARHQDSIAIVDEPYEDENKPVYGKSAQIVVGLLEGIVPEDHPVKEIRGSAVFVEGPEINRFLRDVETGLVQPICGGEAAEYVGRQPADPALDLDSMDPIAAASGGSGGSGGSGAVDLTGGNSGASRFGSFTGGSHSGGRGEGRNSGWF